MHNKNIHWPTSRIRKLTNINLVWSRRKYNSNTRIQFYFLDKTTNTIQLSVIQSIRLSLFLFTQSIFFLIIRYALFQKSKNDENILVFLYGIVHVLLYNQWHPLELVINFYSTFVWRIRKPGKDMISNKKKPTVEKEKQINQEGKE